MRKLYYTENEENPFALSIGDLMAALLMVFILLLSATLLQLENQYQIKRENLDDVQKNGEQITEIAHTYKNIQENLYNDLTDEFERDLRRWGATIERKTLAIKFTSPEVLFSPGKADVKEEFKIILDDFFPRYLKILTKYNEYIEEIRIEGHTSSEWNHEVNSDNAYFKNMELSQDRTRTVLEYCLGMIYDVDLKEWSRSKITANGLSFSKRVYENGIENSQLSRRVEFRVRTDSENRIKSILGVGKKD